MNLPVIRIEVVGGLVCGLIGLLSLAGAFSRFADSFAMRFFGAGCGLAFIGTGIVRVAYGLHYPWAALELGGRIFFWAAVFPIAWLLIAGAFSRTDGFPIRIFSGLLGLSFLAQGLVDVGRTLGLLTVDPELVSKVFVWALIPSLVLLLIVRSKVEVPKTPF